MLELKLIRLIDLLEEAVDGIYISGLRGEFVGKHQPVMPLNIVFLNTAFQSEDYFKKDGTRVKRIPEICSSLPFKLFPNNY